MRSSRWQCLFVNLMRLEETLTSRLWRTTPYRKSILSLMHRYFCFKKLQTRTRNPKWMLKLIWIWNDNRRLKLRFLQRGLNDMILSSNGKIKFLQRLLRFSLGQKLGQIKCSKNLIRMVMVSCKRQNLLHA